MNNASPRAQAHRRSGGEPRPAEYPTPQSNGPRPPRANDAPTEFTGASALAVLITPRTDRR